MARPTSDGDRGVRTGLVIQRLRELRAARLPSVELCHRLDYQGWDNLRDASDAGPFFLLGPLGSRRLARRVLDEFLEDAEGAVVLPASTDDTVEAMLLGESVRCEAGPARRALERQAPAVWTLALPRRRGRWSIHFLSPVPPEDGDTVASLTQRYLNVLEERWRDLV